MKKTLLLFTIVMLGAFTVKAQLLNASFETWVTAQGSLPGVPLPPYNYEHPENWSSMDQFSMAAGLSLVRKDSTNKVSGNYSVRLESQDTTLPLIGSVTFPGIISTGTLSFSVFSQSVSFTGGQPFSMRPGKLEGYLRYAGVNNDSARITVELRKGGSVVAEGSFSTGNIGTFSRFEVPLAYTSCETPDSALINIFSSDPASAQPGSVLNVDSLFFTGTAPVTPPIVEDDLTSVTEGGSVTVDVLSNDGACDGRTIDNSTLAVLSQGTKGTAVVSSGQITYTSNTGTGSDSFTYEVCDNAAGGTNCASATVNVTITVGINDPKNLVDLDVYPNPAKNLLNVKLANYKMSDLKLNIYDMTGRNIKSVDIQKEVTAVDVSAFEKSLYFYQLADGSNTVLANGKFNVVE